MECGYDRLENRRQTERLEEIANIYNLKTSLKRNGTIPFKGKYGVGSKSVINEEITEKVSNFK
jgi:hypothetical protein